MRAKTKALALAALVLFLAGTAARGADATVDCTLKQAASLPIERMADGAVTVTIKVQGVDEKFLLGLDVPVSEIVGSVAEGLHLRANGLGKKSYAVEHFE